MHQNTTCIHQIKIDHRIRHITLNIRPPARNTHTSHTYIHTHTQIVLQPEQRFSAFVSRKIKEKTISPVVGMKNMMAINDDRQTVPSTSQPLLPTYLSTYLRTYVPTYLPTHLPTLGFATSSIPMLTRFRCPPGLFFVTFVCVCVRHQINQRLHLRAHSNSTHKTI